MPLPIVSMPTKYITVPSTKQKAKVRPFTVADEKVLLMAGTGDTADKVMAIQTIIKQCAIDPIDTDNLIMADAEYMFVKFRSMSVSNVMQIKVDGIDVLVDLESIQVAWPKDANNIVTIGAPDDKLYVELKYPTLHDIASGSDQDNIAIIASFIKTIYKGDAAYDPKDFSVEDMAEFISKIPLSDSRRIKSWAENAPFSYIDIPFKSTTRRLRGFQDFFGL